MIEVNLVAVFVSSILAIAVGSVWYSPSVFGKRWMKDVGISEEDMQVSKQGMFKRFAAHFVMIFLALYVLSHFLVIAEAFEGTNPMPAAVWISVLVVALSAGAVIWERKSLAYFAINGGYTAVVLIGGAAVIQYWPW